jgi:glycosyltransferase involved in cell wall biosynthesis
MNEYERCTVQTPLSRTVDSSNISQYGIAGTPRFTVVIPCYNAKRWISATLKSVLAQTWRELEIIVVDDGSSDGSADLVRSQFPSVTLIQQVNRGVAAARNKGIANATGDWIAFIDADDIWLPGKLETQWRLLSTQSHARMAYTAWYVWHCTAPEPTKGFVERLELENCGESSRWSGPSGWIYPELLEDCCVWTSTVIAHRSLFDEIGVFDEKLPIGEDYDLWLRASRVTPILRVPAPLALYRMHPNSITKSAPAINFQAMVLSRAIEHWGLDSPDGRRTDERVVARALGRIWRDFAGAHLAAGNLALARHGGLMALRNDWRQRQGWKLLARTILASLKTVGSR